MNGTPSSSPFASRVARISRGDLSATRSPLRSGRLSTVPPSISPQPSWYGRPDNRQPTNRRRVRSRQGQGRRDAVIVGLAGLHGHRAAVDVAAWPSRVLRGSGRPARGVLTRERAGVVERAEEPHAVRRDTDVLAGCRRPSSASRTPTTRQAQGRARRAPSSPVRTRAAATRPAGHPGGWGRSRRPRPGRS